MGLKKTAEHYTPRRADEGFCSDRPLVQPAPLPTMTESLAEALSKEGNDQLTYDSALRAVSKLDSWKMDSPDFATFDKRVVEFKDLPLKLAHSRPTKLTHIVDVVEDMDDNVDRGGDVQANSWPTGGPSRRLAGPHERRRGRPRQARARTNVRRMGQLGRDWPC